MNLNNNNEIEQAMAAKNTFLLCGRKILFFKHMYISNDKKVLTLFSL